MSAQERAFTHKWTGGRPFVNEVQTACKIETAPEYTNFNWHEVTCPKCLQAKDTRKRIKGEE